MNSTLVNKTWCSRYPHCHYIIYDNGGEHKIVWKYHENHKGLSISQPSRIHKQKLYWSKSIKLFSHASRCLTRHYQHSMNQWHRCIPNKCNMDHALNLSHNTKSLTRSSCLLGQFVWHSLPCQLEQNWRPKAMPNRLKCRMWKSLKSLLGQEKLMTKSFLEKMVPLQIRIQKWS